MGQKNIKIRYCDHCGTDEEPTTAHTLHWDRKKWTLDLCDRCHRNLENHLYAIPGITPPKPENNEPKPPAYPAAEGINLTEVRQWANQQGIEVSKRGRINTNVIQAFKTAHNTETD